MTNDPFGGGQVRPVRRRGPVMTIGLTVLLVLVVGGAWFFVTRVLGRENIDLTAQADPAGASIVRVTADNASISVRPSNDGLVHVRTSGSYTGTAPTVTAITADDQTQVSVSCSSQWLGWCSMTATIEMPTELALVVRTDNGDIEVTGLSAELDLSSDNGEIAVSGAARTVTLASDNGDLSVTDSAARTVSAQSDNGSIEIVLSVVPDTVQVRSNNGDIDVTVPGTAKYLVDGQSDNGDVTIQVGVDSDSTHRVTAVTDNGDVKVRPAA